jgi:hypothetical protein
VTIVALSMVAVLGGSATASPQREAAKHYAAAHSAIEEGDLNRATEELRASVAQKPTVNAYLMLGNVYVKLGQLDNAREAFQKILELKTGARQRQSVEQVIAELELLKRTTFLITTTPPGATVYVDLKSEGARGKTPMSLPVLPGPHRVIVELEGYHPSTLTSVVAVEGQVVPVNATLRLRGCAVRIATTQQGVTVSIDGGEAAPPPTGLVVAPGTHLLQFAGEGLKAKSRSVRCEGEQLLEIAETLEPLPKATLALLLPEHAEVHVDGRVVAAAEAGKLALGAGTHHVEVSAAGKTPWQSDVTLRQGESAALTPFFAPAQAQAQARPQSSISVAADAAEATILVDGKRVESGSRVTTSAGAHTVEISATGREPFRDKVVLGEAENARIDAHLKLRGSTELAVGLSFFLLAAGAEAVGVAGHYSAQREISGSQQYNNWHAVEMAGFYGGAALAAVGLVATIVGVVQRHSRGVAHRE